MSCRHFVTAWCESLHFHSIHGISTTTVGWSSPYFLSVSTSESVGVKFRVNFPQSFSCTCPLPRADAGDYGVVITGGSCSANLVTWRHCLSFSLLFGRGSFSLANRVVPHSIVVYYSREGKKKNKEMKVPLKVKRMTTLQQAKQPQHFRTCLLPSQSFCEEEISSSVPARMLDDDIA